MKLNEFAIGLMKQIDILKKEVREKYGQGSLTIALNMIHQELGYVATDKRSKEIDVAKGHIE